MTPLDTNREPQVRAEIWECLVCGGWMSRVVPQGRHALRRIGGRLVDCKGNTVAEGER